MQVNVNANGVVADTVTTREKAADDYVRVPIVDLNSAEGISLGFRQEMFCIETGDAKTEMSVASDLAGPCLTLSYGDRSIMVNTAAILREWVTTFDPKTAERIPVS